MKNEDKNDIIWMKTLNNIGLQFSFVMSILGLCFLAGLITLVGVIFWLLKYELGLLV